jgi:UDP-N-acetylmuramoyl-tripeptide--D-alanyl-D-alanine ligase
MTEATLVTLGARLRLDDVRDAAGGRIASGSLGGDLTGVSIDSRTVAPGELFVAIAGKHFDGHDFVAAAAAAGAVAALVHRDVAVPSGMAVIRVADTTAALADLGRRVRLAADVPVVGITGSAGKTTTKDMTAAILASRGPVLKTEGNLNNQYGLPLTLLRLGPAHWAAVLELGMSAAGEIRALSDIARPDIAVMTNVGSAHLEFFPSKDAIARAKAEIFLGLRDGGVAVLNGDDPLVRRAGEEWGGTVIWFGRDRRHDVSAEKWRGTAFGMRFDMRIAGEVVDVALPLAGPHHVMNFLAAAAAAHRLGIGMEAIAQAATTMKAASHRGEIRRLRSGVTVLDDCYNASPEAVDASVVALGLAGGGRRVAFLGDMLELGREGRGLHRDLGGRLEGRVDVLVGVGALAEEFIAGARDHGLPSEALRHFADAREAAAAAADIVRAGDAVLVKGSRGMRMEGIVDALSRHFGEADD